MSGIDGRYGAPATSPIDQNAATTPAAKESNIIHPSSVPAAKPLLQQGTVDVATRLSSASTNNTPSAKQFFKTILSGVCNLFKPNMRKELINDAIQEGKAVMAVANRVAEIKNREHAHTPALRFSQINNQQDLALHFQQRAKQSEIARGVRENRNTLNKTIRDLKMDIRIVQTRAAYVTGENKAKLLYEAQYKEVLLAEIEKEFKTGPEASLARTLLDQLTQTASVYTRVQEQSIDWNKMVTLAQDERLGIRSGDSTERQVTKMLSKQVQAEHLDQLINKANVGYQNVDLDKGSVATLKKRIEEFQAELKQCRNVPASQARAMYLSHLLGDIGNKLKHEDLKKLCTIDPPLSRSQAPAKELIEQIRKETLRSLHAPETPSQDRKGFEGIVQMSGGNNLIQALQKGTINTNELEILRSMANSLNSDRSRLVQSEGSTTDCYDAVRAEAMLATIKTALKRYIENCG